MSELSRDPAAQPELFGQDQALAALSRGFALGRVPHAWLLTGPMGVGKATLAHRLARWLLAGMPHDSAGRFTVPAEHPVFRQVAGGAHPDLRVLAPPQPEDGGKRRSAEINVEQVRGLGGFFAHTAGSGGFRVAVVDSADDLNRNSANALLKLLEEPPRKSVLLLVAHAPGRLLPTIRSRCARLALAPLPAAIVDDLLKRFLPDSSATERAALVDLAEGSIGRALELAEGGGLPLLETIDGALKRIAGGRLGPAERLTVARELGKDQDGFRLAGRLLLWRLGREIAGAARSGDGLLAPVLTGARLDRWAELWENTARLFARADDLSLDRPQAAFTALTDIARLAGRGS